MLVEIPEKSKPRGRQILEGSPGGLGVIASAFDSAKNLVKSGIDSLAKGNVGVPNSAIVKGVQQGALGSLGGNKGSSGSKGGRGNNGGSMRGK